MRDSYKQISRSVTNLSAPHPDERLIVSSKDASIKKQIGFAFCLSLWAKLNCVKFILNIQPVQYHVDLQFFSHSTFNHILRF